PEINPVNALVSIQSRAQSRPPCLRCAVLDPFTGTNIPENDGGFHPTGVWLKRTEVLPDHGKADHAVIPRYWYQPTSSSAHRLRHTDDWYRRRESHGASQASQIEHADSPRTRLGQQTERRPGPARGW